MLTPEEKTLLREAICSGYFSQVGIAKGPNGQPAVGRGQLTPDILKTVAEMSIEDVRVKLADYNLTKKQTLLDQKRKTEQALEQVTSALSEFV